LEWIAWGGVGDFTVEDESLRIPCNAASPSRRSASTIRRSALDAAVKALERLDLTKGRAKISSGNACKLFGR